MEPCKNCDCTIRVTCKNGKVVCGACDLDPTRRAVTPPSAFKPQEPHKGKNHGPVLPFPDMVQTGPFTWKILMSFEELAQRAERNKR